MRLMWDEPFLDKLAVSDLPKVILWMILLMFEHSTLWVRAEQRNRSTMAAKLLISCSFFYDYSKNISDLNSRGSNEPTRQTLLLFLCIRNTMLSYNEIKETVSKFSGMK